VRKQKCEQFGVLVTRILGDRLKMRQGFNKTYSFLPSESWGRSKGGGGPDQQSCDGSVEFHLAIEVMTKGCRDVVIFEPVSLFPLSPTSTSTREKIRRRTVDFEVTLHHVTYSLMGEPQLKPFASVWNFSMEFRKGIFPNYV
jgi:hypothetical protein